MLLIIARFITINGLRVSLLAWPALMIGLMFGLDCTESNLMANVLIDRSSMDERPIDIKIGPTQYRIPRNYLFAMENWDGGPQKNISIRVQYPGFLPYSFKTKDCFERRVSCQLIEIHLSEASYLSSSQLFESQRKLFHNQRPQNGPYDYQLFQVGPDDARINWYKKKLNDIDLYVSCIEWRNTSKLTSGQTCRTIVRTRTGAEFIYHFSGDKLEHLEAIVVGLCDLIDRFALEATL